MTSEQEPTQENEPPESEAALTRLLKQAFAETPPPRRDLLLGVQRRIRLRSRGRFFSNRWSLERHSPVLTYLVTALFMLTVLGLSYFLLRPLLEVERQKQGPASPKATQPTRSNELRHK